MSKYLNAPRLKVALYQRHITQKYSRLQFTRTLLSDTSHLTCHLPYNIDASKENATQTSTLNPDNTKETFTGQLPPTQMTQDILLTILSETTMYYSNSIKLYLLKKKNVFFNFFFYSPLVESHLLGTRADKR